LPTAAVLSQVDYYLPDPAGGGMGPSSSGGAIALLTPDQYRAPGPAFAGS
jgi:hypothetical protein